MTMKNNYYRNEKFTDIYPDVQTFLTEYKTSPLYDEEMQDTVKKLAEKYHWITPIYESVLKTKLEQEAFAATVNSIRLANRYTIDSDYTPF